MISVMSVLSSTAVGYITKYLCFPLNIVTGTISYCVCRETGSFKKLLFFGAKYFSCFQYTSLHKLTIRKWFRSFCSYLRRSKICIKCCFTWFISHSKYLHILLTLLSLSLPVYLHDDQTSFCALFRNDGANCTLFGTATALLQMSHTIFSRALCLLVTKGNLPTFSILWNFFYIYIFFSKRAVLPLFSLFYE